MKKKKKRGKLESTPFTALPSVTDVWHGQNEANYKKAAKAKLIYQRRQRRALRQRQRLAERVMAEVILAPMNEREPAHAAPSPDVPKVLRSSTPIEIGDKAWSGGVPAYIWAETYDGLLVSERHYKLPNGAWSGGGPFYAFHGSQEHEGRSTATYWRIGNRYNAAACGVAGVRQERWATTVPYLQPWSQVEAETRVHYATGYARARPDRPEASVGQFLIELRDIPTIPFRRGIQKFRSLSQRTGGNIRWIPKVLVRELLDFRNLGSEYLNGVFGWKPFVRDCQSMFKLWQKLDQRIAQLVRENGKSIRRKAQVKRESDTTQEPLKTFGWAYANVRGGPPNWMFDGGSAYRVTTSWSERVWFSGSFRYYVPDIGSSLWTIRAKQALFGVLPTPELLWEVLPWSWLIDWFSNVGDIYANLSPGAVDNLTVDHSFIMRHVTYKKQAQVDSWHSELPYGGSPGLQSGWPAHRGHYVSTEKWEIKARVGGGNPFGLNVHLPDLNPGQLAILAALGISRSRLT